MPPVTFRCRAVLLDMDGTLVDSTKAVAAQWGRWGARHGLPLDRILEVAHGRPSFETMTILAPHAATPEEHARFLQEEEENEGGSIAIPGALAFVSRLPRDRWAVVTSAPGRLARLRLASSGFPPPPVLIAPEDVSRGKPDPLPYLMAAGRLGVEPERCLVVEDTPAGLVSARAAGMIAIGIATTYPAAVLKAGFAIADFTALEVEAADGEISIHLRPSGDCATILT